jgi:triosephosphate isomerase
MRRKIAAGNWKMNGTADSLGAVRALAGAHPDPACEVILCPPATLLARMAAAAEGTPILIGGQDCHPDAAGAHTGDVSAEMLADAGARAVIVGHSERRQNHAESDERVAAKARAAWRAGLLAIICIGETEAERDAGQTLNVVTRQLAGSVPDGATAANSVIAYEPVWAIGTGRTPTLAEIAEVHGAIRARLVDRLGEAGDGLRVLYGGSVKPSNAAEIFAIANVDGGLVGGASLKPADFGPIIAAAGGAAAT